MNEMTIGEKQNILTKTFDELWNEMWGSTNIENNKYKSEKMISKKKYETIKHGVEIENIHYTLKKIVDNSETKWEETEWEFPKGRRNQNEKDIICALREFEEETGI